MRFDAPSRWFDPIRSIPRQLTQRLRRLAAGCVAAMLAMAAQAAPFAYVANQADNRVTVIDMASYAIVSTITLGNGAYPPNTPVYPSAVAANTMTGKVYVGSRTGVFVIDAATKTVVGHVAMTQPVLELAVNSQGTRVYALVAGTVRVIASATRTVIASIAVDVSAGGLALSHDGATLYVGNAGSDVTSAGISIINTATNSLTVTIPTTDVAPGFHPTNLKVNPDDDTVFMVGPVDGPSFLGFGLTYLTLDTATRAVDAYTLPTPAKPIGLIKGIAFNEDGSRLYIGGATFNSALVAEIDTEAQTILRIIPLATGGSEYHYTKGLASTTVNNKFVLAGFVFEHRIHSPSEPRSVSFVDVASGAIARYAPLAETGLYGAYAVGDILEAPAPVATATTPSRITLHLRTHSLSRNQWTPLVTSVAGASPGGKVTLTFIDASQHPHSTVSVSVPLIGNVAAYNLPPCASQFDNVRLKEIVCSGHFKVRAKYSGDARNGRSISEKFVLKRAAS